METSKKTKCPACGVEIDLLPKQDNPVRLVAFHACGGLGMRQVLEVDAPDYPPVLLRDRLEQSEHSSKKTRR